MRDTPDPTLPAVFTRSEAQAANMSPGAVRHRVESGRWRALRYGVFCLQEKWDESDDRGRHLLLARAALKSVGGRAWASHTTAAAVFHLPTPRQRPGVYLTRRPPGSTRYADDLVVEVATLAPGDRLSVGGLPLTSLRRTVADCLRHCAPADGLAIVDAALAGQPRCRRGVGAVLDECAEWPFARKASAVLALADGRRESPLESWSLWVMHRFGLPLPQPQGIVYDQNGVFIGRVDFWWEQFGVVGEADGTVKYAVDGDANPRRVQAALVAEKRREDRLRGTGLDVVRWGARDLERPGWASRLAARLHERRGRDFRGRVVVQPDRR